MSSDPRAFLARQLRAHLESLKAAGVQFVPKGEPLAVAATTPEPEAPAERTLLRITAKQEPEAPAERAPLHDPARHVNQEWFAEQAPFGHRQRLAGRVGPKAAIVRIRAVVA